LKKIFSLLMTFFLFQAIHLIAIWENLLPSTPKFIMSYFRRREILVAAACGVSFLLSILYAIQVSEEIVHYIFNNTFCWLEDIIFKN
jgi:hypothetical protein